MPRAQQKKTELDSREVKQQVREAVIAAEGPASLEVEPIEVIDGPNFADREEALKFMEDQLTIIIHPSQEKKPEDPVYVAVNGRGCYIWRNKKTIVRRKYVERLARAKADNVEQDISSPDPAVMNRLKITAAVRYPFSVLADPHPDGGAWLQKILQDG